MVIESPELGGVKPVKLSPEDQAVLDGNMLVEFKDGLIKKYKRSEKVLSNLSLEAVSKLQEYLGNPNIVPPKAKISEYRQDTVEGAALHAYYTIQDRGGSTEIAEDDDGNPFAALKGLKLE